MSLLCNLKARKRPYIREQYFFRGPEVAKAFTIALKELFN